MLTKDISDNRSLTFFPPKNPFPVKIQENSVFNFTSTYSGIFSSFYYSSLLDGNCALWYSRHCHLCSICMESTVIGGPLLSIITCVKEENSIDCKVLCLICRIGSLGRTISTLDSAVPKPSILYMLTNFHCSEFCSSGNLQ
jgi:hypothetical protein